MPGAGTDDSRGHGQPRAVVFVFFADGHSLDGDRVEDRAVVDVGGRDRSDPSGDLGLVVGERAARDVDVAGGAAGIETREGRFPDLVDTLRRVHVPAAWPDAAQFLERARRGRRPATPDRWPYGRGP
ncbi:hypothetical protein [Embleya sp. NPDC005575]|uniref:hypothetical protein n=1 Tax=Embleya sp. NPDC005575 TaxID=3156892 RepID=UPI0033A4FE36